MVGYSGGSRIDRYADAILLNIAYHFDGSRPLSSVMEASFYENIDYFETTNFYESMEKDLPANKQYMRYWHGSAAIVRLMHLFTDIRGMYIFQAVVIAVLLAVLVFLLVRNGYRYAALAVMVALTGVAIWFVPFSLEYTWMFVVMLAASAAAVMLTVRNKDVYVPVLFLASGVVACYLDFLTTETVTLTAPLLLILYIRMQKRRADRSDIVLAAGSAVSWLLGFSLMWVSKWMLAHMILQKDVAPYVTANIADKLDGDINGLPSLVVMAAALVRNVRVIFPLEYGTAGIMIVAAAVIAAIWRLYVYGGGRQADIRAVLIYLCVGTVPYIRYIVLHNHSYKHYFFTYRAQAATLLALMFILDKYSAGYKKSGKRR